MRPSEGGGRIMIEPTGLRRSASRLRDVATELGSVAGAVACPALPEMPPGLAPAVSGRLTDFGRLLSNQQQALAQSADELVRRAFWADIADELLAGTPLSATRLRQFKAWLGDGSLMRYAE